MLCSHFILSIISKGDIPVKSKCDVWGFVLVYWNMNRPVLHFVVLLSDLFFRFYSALLYHEYSKKIEVLQLSVLITNLFLKVLET